MSVLSTCRVFVVGDRGVGKTTLIRRFMENNTEVGDKPSVHVSHAQSFQQTSYFSRDLMCGCGVQ